MPIEEKLAEFLESYEAVLKDMHDRFGSLSLLIEAQEYGGNGQEVDLERRFGGEWEYFAHRMSTVQIPPGATVVNFATDAPLVKMLKCDGSGISLRFGYFNHDFGFSANYSYMVQQNQPIPGSTLNENITVLFQKARKVEWVTVKRKQIESGEELAFYNESADGVMEVCDFAGNFWSPKRWEAKAEPLVEVMCGPFHLLEELPYKDRMSITSARFSKNDVGLGEIDAFLARVVDLPTLETVYPICVR